MRRIIQPGLVSAWILMAILFMRELTVSVVLSRPGTEMLAVPVPDYANDGLQGKLSALGIAMILIFTALVLAAQWVGRRAWR